MPGAISRLYAEESAATNASVRATVCLVRKGEAIHIGKLERFLADFDSEAGWSHEYIPEKSRGRVAVIGSGPAGLTIAGDLSRKGFAVEIFEMEAEPGGMLKFGIPEYRLPKEVVSREISKIRKTRR